MRHMQRNLPDSSEASPGSAKSGRGERERAQSSGRDCGAERERDLSGGIGRKPHGQARGGASVRKPVSGEQPAPVAAGGQRVAKAIARAGLCSRREAERWIAAGRVAVNGATLTTPAVIVSPADRVTVDGVPLPAPEPPRLWRYHKPRGRVTSHHDPEGRPTVFEALPEGLPRVISVGRLDFNTEGLLLLTNDGALAHHLELPTTGWLRRYRARVHGRVDEAALAALANGMTINGMRYGPIEARLDHVGASNAWLTIALREGKNREVRKVLGALGLEVARLIRVSFGPFQLGDLGPGALEEVAPRVLVDQLGRAKARELGIAVGVPETDRGKPGSDPVGRQAGAGPSRAPRGRGGAP